MKVYTTREVIAILKVNNYVVIRTSGSHQIWYNAEKKNKISLPTGHRQDINRMLWQRIVRENQIVCRF